MKMERKFSFQCYTNQVVANKSASKVGKIMETILMIFYEQRWEIKASPVQVQGMNY